MTTRQTETFAGSYALLQKSVQRLRQTEVSDIDELVGIVDSATEAYKACQARLEAIAALTGDRLADPALPAAEGEGDD
jgi:exodeoxyribonuclease VII small subunit